MALLTLAECKDWLDITSQEFEISSVNDTLSMKYDSGSATDVSLTDGTYSPSEMATHLETQIDSALSCSSSVSWNSTTCKFTITVSGHTIQYINSGSDAGSTLGFTENSSDTESITSDTACGDPTAIIDDIRGYVEKFTINYCGKDFESTSYNETYDGNGENYFYVDNPPIISLSRLCVSSNYAIKINNSNSDTYATVSVTSTGVVLNKDGSETTLLFADYSTMTLMIAAIDNETGWQAESMNSNYDAYMSSELLEQFGSNCLDEDWAYLSIREEPESDFKVDKNTGKIYLSSGFTEGNQNIYVSYTGGYTTTPADLKMGMLIFIKLIYDKRAEESFGVKGYSVDKVRKEFQELPSETRDIFDSYRRLMI